MHEYHEFVLYLSLAQCIGKIPNMVGNHYLTIHIPSTSPASDGGYTKASYHLGPNLNSHLFHICKKRHHPQQLPAGIPISCSKPPPPPAPLSHSSPGQTAPAWSVPPVGSGTLQGAGERPEQAVVGEDRQEGLRARGEGGGQGTNGRGGLGGVWG